MSSDRIHGTLNVLNFFFIMAVILSLSYLLSLRVHFKASKQPTYIITIVDNLNQVDHLINLGNVLKTLDHPTWLVVENADELSDIVGDILKKTKVPFEHLLGKFITKLSLNSSKTPCSQHRKTQENVPSHG